MPIGNQAKKVIHIYNNVRTTMCGHPLDDVHRAIDYDEAKEIATCALCRAMAHLPVNSQNYLEKIDAIYAVLSQDEGGEGVVCMLRDGTPMPLIAADETRVKEMLPYAHQLSNALNVRMKLVKFTSRQEMEDIVPLAESKIPGSP